MRLAGKLSFGLVALVSAVAAAGLPGFSSAQTLAPSSKAEIVFTNGGRVVSIAADGSERRILSRLGSLGDRDSRVTDNLPAISPDGTSLLYSRLDGDSSSIIVAERDGSRPRSILATDERGESFEKAAWSADGSLIYVIFDRGSGNGSEFGIGSVRPDGSGFRVISSDTLVFAGRDWRGSTYLPITLSVSPDGEGLLVSYDDFLSRSRTKAMFIDIESGRRRLLQRDAARADFSPDGSEIVFASARESRKRTCYRSGCRYKSHLYLMSSDGSNVRRLLPRRFNNHTVSPSWSNDGSRIAFAMYSRFSGGVDSHELFSVTPQGTCLTRLTNGSPDSGSPSWEPEAGLSANPGACGDLAPDPLVELEPGPEVVDQDTKRFWMGPSFRGLLLSDFDFISGDFSQIYSDCGNLNPRGCPPLTEVESSQVCERPEDVTFSSGEFSGFKSHRGGLIAKTKPRALVLSSIYFSDGAATVVRTSRKVGGREVRFRDHLARIRKLRPVDSADLPASDYPPPVFALPTVKRARRVETAHQRGSLGRLNPTRRSYLRFARSLEKIGPVRTVKCKRFKNIPGSVKFR